MPEFLPDKAEIEHRLRRTVSDAVFNAFLAMDAPCRTHALGMIDDLLRMLFLLLEHTEASRMSMHCKHPGLIDFSNAAARLQCIFRPDRLETDNFLTDQRYTADFDANNYGLLQLKAWLEDFFPRSTREES